MLPLEGFYNLFWAQFQSNFLCLPSDFKGLCYVQEHSQETPVTMSPEVAQHPVFRWWDETGQNSKNVNNVLCAIRYLLSIPTVWIWAELTEADRSSVNAKLVMVFQIHDTYHSSLVSSITLGLFGTYRNVQQKFSCWTLLESNLIVNYKRSGWLLCIIVSLLRHSIRSLSAEGLFLDLWILNIFLMSNWCNRRDPSDKHHYPAGEIQGFLWDTEDRR